MINNKFLAPILDASGVEGPFGDGYRHHRFLKPLGLDFKGVEFVAKTTTLEARAGNMPLAEDGTQKNWLPRCILPNFRPETFALSLRMFMKGIMLNSVGLSGPGAEALFASGRWQARTDPFYISFMSVASTPRERLTELEAFMEMFLRYLRGFKGRVGIQINKSCPNIKLATGKKLDPSSLIKELEGDIRIIHHLSIPIMWKFNILTPPEAIREALKDNSEDAICISNTLPWRELSNRIDWQGLFGTDISPLAEFGGGGLSGAPLLPLVAEWVQAARKCGIKNHINAGGGILSKEDVITLWRAGADSCFIGSVANLRWWRMKSIIKTAHKQFSPYA